MSVLLFDRLDVQLPLSCTVAVVRAMKLLVPSIRATWIEKLCFFELYYSQFLQTEGRKFEYSANLLPYRNAIFRY